MIPAKPTDQKSLKRVVSIGQCGPDNGALERFLAAHFAIEFLPAERLADALRILEEGEADLVLVNRKLDVDYSDGLEVIRSLKSDARTSSTPVMLVSNYPEYQEQAVTAGAEPGFGKLEFSHPGVIERLARYLKD